MSYNVHCMPTFRQLVIFRCGVCKATQTHNSADLNEKGEYHNHHCEYSLDSACQRVWMVVQKRTYRVQKEHAWVYVRGKADHGYCFPLTVYRTSGEDIKVTEELKRVFETEGM